MNKNNVEVKEPTLTPIDIQAGYDGGGMACGPVEGNTVTEVMFVENDGKPLFVSVSRMMEFVNVFVSDVSLFSLLMHMCDNNVNFEYTQKLIESTAKYDTSCELPHVNMIGESEYQDAIYFVMKANDHFYCSDDHDKAKEWLDEFLHSDEELGWESEYILEAIEEEEDGE